MQVAPNRVRGHFAKPVPLLEKGYECPVCGGRFANLRAETSKKYRAGTIPQHRVTIRCRGGIGTIEYRCPGGEGMYPTEPEPGPYPYRTIFWERTVAA